ncbi:MAG TPA: polysaccharide deacetylase family protein [Hyphomicrobiaceae bacterium]|nr:polysaccharide deacetylase family protein [Hyphomicrobiaceae bacterium]
MNRMGRIAIAAFLLAALAARGSAQAQPAGCANPRAIGVSRVIEVNATGGPRFGAQFHRSSLLNDGEVILTFDDGPLQPHTQQVLAALADHCTKATFFMVGRRAMADPALAQEVARQGHTVGTHTWSHRNMSTITTGHALAEIDLGFSAVRRSVGAPIAPFFRFPYLVQDEAMLAHLAARNVAAFSIDIDPFDYRTRDPAQVVRDVVRKVATAKKGIILMHDVEPSTAGGIKALLDELQARGIRVVHLVATGKAETVATYDAFVAKPLTDAARDLLTRRSSYWPLTKEGELVSTIPGSARTAFPARPPLTRH